jgi:hypothetical protein
MDMYFYALGIGEQQAVAPTNPSLLAPRMVSWWPVAILLAAVVVAG